MKGDIVMVISDPEVTWKDKEENLLDYPEWKNLSLLYGEKVWPVTSMTEDRWYAWFERVEIPEL